MGRTAAGVKGIKLKEDDYVVSATAIRDKNGRLVGTQKTDKNGLTTFRDSKGIRVGTSKKNSWGKTEYRDKNGQYIGSSQEDKKGNITYRNKSGKKVFTEKKTKTGYEIRDLNLLCKYIMNDYVYLFC